MVTYDKSTITDCSVILPNRITQKLFVSVGAIQIGNTLLLSYRDKSKEQGEAWEFPGGKIFDNESSFEALKRELLEELDITILGAKKIGQVCYLYDQKIFVSLDAWSIKKFSGDVKNKENQITRWFHLDELSSIEMTKPNRLILKYCLEECDI